MAPGPATFLILALALLPLFALLIDRSSTYQVNAPGVVVITGATSGLGLDSAFDLARKGYFVLAGARSASKAVQLQERAAVAGIANDRFKAIELDVSDPSMFAGAEALARQAMADTGLPFTGLVNNAGVNYPQVPGDTTLERWEKLYAVNVFAPVALVETFDGLLRESKGRVVNVGSIAGEVSVPGGAPYHSSKFALRALTDVMRQEYAPAGVSVSLVAPGFVRSQMCREEPGSPCGEVGPAETTTPAYYDALSSARPKSKYIVAHIGGGWSAALWVPVINLFPSRAFDYVQAAIRSTL